MKKILFFLTVIAFSGNAQNLVNNPSFENYSSCPTGGVSTLDLAIDWSNPYVNVIGDTCSTSDYYHSCSTFGGGVPSNVMGNEPAHTGNGYAAIIIYEGIPDLFGNPCNSMGGTGWREYIQNELTAPLIAGEEYCISFWVSLADDVKWASNNFGIYLSPTQVAINCTTVGSASDLSSQGITPQLVYSGAPITNSNGWTKLQFNYVATGGEQYMVIGNFFGNSSTNYACANSGAFNPYAYYYIDDVSVINEVCCDPTFNNPSPLCASDAPVTLTPATPGGTWAGTGVNASGQFDPAVAGAGNHTITYTLPCGSEDVVIVVSGCNMDVCLETNGDFTVSNGVGPYTWAEWVTTTVTPTNQTECTSCGGTWIPGIPPIVPASCSVSSCPVTGYVDFTTGTTITPTTNFPIRVTDNTGTTFIINSAGSLSNCSTISCPTLTTNITSQTNVNCFGQSTGAATVSAGNGTAPYTYTWMPGNLSGASQSGLVAGNYTINISDGAGCTGSMNVNITQPSAALSATVNTTPTGCGTSTGTATANVSGGTTNYSYVWSNSASTTSSATGLPAGAGTVTITDALGCQLVENFSISTPGSISASITSQTNVNCFGQSTGAATVSASNGSTPYTYTWNPGNLNGASQTGLAAGNYTVDIVDNSGCSTSINVDITQPSAALSGTVNTTPGTCGANDGQATINVSGGTTNYTYSWSNSASTTSSATGLPAGPGTITVTDALGCQLIENFVITTPGAPTLSISNVTGVQCATSTNGGATVNASGGNAPLTYLWSPSGETTPTATGLHAGNNTITVTDASGCVASEVVNVPSPAPIVLSETITNTNCGSADGEIIVNATGGTGTLTYTWTPNVGTGSTISNLIGGTYDLTVEDANGCTVSETYQIDVIGTLPVIASPTSIQVNAGDTVQLFASGATNYSWSPATGLSCTDCPNPIASPTETTIYTVTGTDDFGCSGEATVAILIQVECGDIFIPTIFSPNGDWNNDLQCVMGNCIVEMKYAIYDRWGEKVFETEDQSECWDGTFRGQKLNSGVFAFKFTATLVDGSIINQSGNLTLVR